MRTFESLVTKPIGSLFAFGSGRRFMSVFAFPVFDAKGFDIAGRIPRLRRNADVPYSPPANTIRRIANIATRRRKDRRFFTTGSDDSSSKISGTRASGV